MLCAKCGKEIVGMPVLHMGRYLHQLCFAILEKGGKDESKAPVLDIRTLMRRFKRIRSSGSG
jgi:hypothetical protein